MPVLTRKVTLYPVGDDAEVNRVYNYIRNGQKVQAIMMNKCMTALYIAYMNGATKEELSELKKEYGHIPGSRLGSPYDYDPALFPTGLPLASNIPRVCDQKIKKSFKDGLKYGKVSLPTYKNTAPMMVHNAYVNLYGSKHNGLGLKHEYASPGELVYALENEVSPEVYIHFANKIVFRVVFGSPHESGELRSVFAKIFEGDIKICDSSIGIYDKKIILNLALEFEKEKTRLDEDVVVGVDLGMATPAVCALNNDFYTRVRIGNYNDFIRKRVQLQSQRRRLQSALKSANGGHGRNKKLKHLEVLSKRERQFAKNYNHYVSKEVVRFALNNKAKYINIEDLGEIPKEKKKEFVLRNWSYYELQQMITYKAASYGIEVRKVNPAYTSQICSVCGEEGDRQTQAVFVCNNPKCKSKKMYKKGSVMYADFNAARNIAMSQDFTA